MCLRLVREWTCNGSLHGKEIHYTSKQRLWIAIGIKRALVRDSLRPFAE